MKNRYELKAFVVSKKGLATLEFAILFLPFFLLIMVILETMILLYQTSTIDYITTSAGQYASSSDPDFGYEKRFQEYIDKHKKNLLLFTDGSLTPSLQFCRSIEELENNNCTGNDRENKLIIYTLSYKIKPLFSALRIFQGLENTTSKVVYFSEKSEYDPTSEENQNHPKAKDEKNKN